MKRLITNFFKNKNIVTIIGFGVCFAIIVFAYNYRINQKVNLVTVPYAKREILAREELTKDNVGTKKMPSSMLTATVIRNVDSIIGKFVNYNTVIPNGSLFYTGSVVSWSEMPDSAWSDIPEGNTIVSFPVDETSTFGNSIYPKDKIDLYLQTYDDVTNKMVYGKLIEGIEVLAVKDTNGNHIFKPEPNQETTSALIFSVSEDLHLLLRKAMLINGAEIVPVPRNAVYTGEVKVTSEYLKTLILSKTEEVVLDKVEKPSSNIKTNK